jgi:hypothetical protein
MKTKDVALAHIRGIPPLWRDLVKILTRQPRHASSLSLECTHFYLPDLWPMHMALALLLAALAQALAPEK